LFSQFSAQARLASVKRAMADLEKMSDPSWHTLLRNLPGLGEYVTLLTNSEGPAQSAPTLTRQEILERDAARKEACAASTAAAAAANAGSGGGGGVGTYLYVPSTYHYSSHRVRTTTVHADSSEIGDFR
jgi:hypothetical protein